MRGERLRFVRRELQRRVLLRPRLRLGGQSVQDRGRLPVRREGVRCPRHVLVDRLVRDRHLRGLRQPVRHRARHLLRWARLRLGDALVRHVQLLLRRKVVRLRLQLRRENGYLRGVLELRICLRRCSMLQRTGLRPRHWLLRSGLRATVRVDGLRGELQLRHVEGCLRLRARWSRRSLMPSRTASEPSACVLIPCPGPTGPPRRGCTCTRTACSRRAGTAVPPMSRCTARDGTDSNERMP